MLLTLQGHGGQPGAAVTGRPGGQTPVGSRREGGGRGQRNPEGCWHGPSGGARRAGSIDGDGALGGPSRLRSCGPTLREAAPRAGPGSPLFLPSWDQGQLRRSPPRRFCASLGSPRAAPGPSLSLASRPRAWPGECFSRARLRRGRRHAAPRPPAGSLASGRPPGCRDGVRPPPDRSGRLPGARPLFVPPIPLSALSS